MVGSIRQGITPFLNLLKSNGGGRVELELEDIHIARTFQHTVYAALARLLLHIVVVFAQQLQDQIERVLEMALTFTHIMLTMEAVGDIGEECCQLQLELLYVSCLQRVADIIEP